MRGRAAEPEIEGIKTSGGLISGHFISLMKEERCSYPNALPETFKLPWDQDGEGGPLDQQEFDLRASIAWEGLRKRWDDYGHRLQEMEPKDARERWTAPLLVALGYEPVATPKQIEISDRLKFRFSHRGWVAESPKPPVVHIVPPSQDLEDRSTRGEPSPHDALQGYLNVHQDKWGLVTNGRFLRLLRDYHHTYSKGYVEFDLEAIFITRSFSDFRALYRMAHASRFLPAKTGDSYLEEYFKHSLAVGEKVGSGLRENVVHAIVALGNGFLDRDLIEELKEDEGACRGYYQEILKVVYRIIFLLYAEQKGMLGGRSTGHDLYLEEYSIASLRDRAMRDGRRDDGHFDHWLGLSTTFEMVRRGAEELGIYPYDGMLFEMNGGEADLSGRRCRNADLLEAIRYLTATEMDRTMRKISYSEISVEEIGSIYEGLLDYTPRITAGAEEIEGICRPANSFVLDPRGSARKTTGSYYTHPDLVSELVKSALEPVLEERLAAAGTDPGSREEAILSIKVCDPACGSGAFLIAATNRLGMELARVRAGAGDGGVPDDDAIQEAKRDVLQSCIFGVDINPMAVELAKVSLWINAMVKDRPLNFLDHRIKPGNSLVGATPELIEKGVPDGAFKPVTGDDKKVARHFRELNKRQRKNRSTIDSWEDDASRRPGYAEEFASLTEMKEDSSEGVAEKCRAYRKLLETDVLKRKRLAADAWTAAFFWPLDDEGAPFPTTAEVRRLGSEDVPEEDPLAAKVEELAEKHKFFHWHLEFPGVFAQGGFDVVLGNPPWEMINLMEKEFFAGKSPEIVSAKTGARRKRLIQKLADTDPELYESYIRATRDAENVSHYLQNSERFPLTSGGRINTYAIFAEQFRAMIRPEGSAGMIVQSGIATDYTYRNFFADLVENAELVSFYDFENKERIFPEVAPVMKFSLMTINGPLKPVEDIDFAFFLTRIDQLSQYDRHFVLTKDELYKINPNTRTCPVFRTRIDAELALKLYETMPIIANDVTTDNPWVVSFKQGLFNMTSDSGLFRTRKQLESEGYSLKGNFFVSKEDEFSPLYEAKFVNQFDHRSGTFEGIVGDAIFKTKAATYSPTIDEKYQPDYLVIPRYWVSRKYVMRATPESWQYDWFIGFRDIIQPMTNARCAIFTVIPKVAVSNKLPLILPQKGIILISALIGCLNSYVFDFVTRQKIGGTSLNFFIVKQLPVIPPDRYTPELLDLIVPKVVELTYTAWDLLPFAQDILEEVGTETWNRWFPDNPLVDGRPAPFRWDEERRAALRAELDAIYAHLYGLTGEELDYILETFPIVKRKDVERYGSFRTKEMILERYEGYASFFDKTDGGAV